MPIIECCFYSGKRQGVCDVHIDQKGPADTATVNHWESVWNKHDYQLFNILISYAICTYDKIALLCFMRVLIKKTAIPSMFCDNPNYTKYDMEVPYLALNVIKISFNVFNFQNHCCSLPADLKQFYQTTNGFLLTWKVKMKGRLR